MHFFNNTVKILAAVIAVSTLLLGCGDGNNQTLLRDPSLCYPESRPWIA